MSLGKNSFFCWLVLYGCITACAAEEKEVKQARLSVVTKGATRASSRRHSCSSPLQPLDGLPSRRSSVPNLTQVVVPEMCPRSIVVNAARLYEISLNPYALEGKLAMVPMMLNEPISGGVGYLIHPNNIVPSSSCRHTYNDILFIPVSKTDSKTYWIAIQVKVPAPKWYEATIWASGNKFPALELKHSNKEMLMLNELVLRRVGSSLTFSPKALDLFLKKYE